jgi:rhodanese-related sulfurtransferase
VLVEQILRTLSFEETLRHIDSGAALVDLRPIDAYLEVHVPGSIELLYEFGPGMPTRARDCIPLDVPLVLGDLGHGDMRNASASLRGKGFTVLGRVEDAINQWAAQRGVPASTEVVTGSEPPEGLILDVADPGAAPLDRATRIPADYLWRRASEVAGSGRVVVAAGAGVRAALAVGVLERAGVTDILFWRTMEGARAVRRPIP